MGAFKEIGLFGVYPDGRTLYARQFSWNKDAVANILFIESSVRVSFYYSNTTDDYMSSRDNMTAEDMYNFLRKWFERRQLPIIYNMSWITRYYVPELADIIMHDFKGLRDSTPKMNLIGIKIGNGLLDDVSDTRGAVNFAWSHALVSEDTRDEYLLSCASGSRYEDEACSKDYETLLSEIGGINYFNIYSPSCEPAFMNVTGGSCDLLYVVSYLNQPEVQVAIHANTTRFPYTWLPCSDLISQQWKDRPSFVIRDKVGSFRTVLRLLPYAPTSLPHNRHPKLH